MVTPPRPQPLPSVTSADEAIRGVNGPTPIDSLLPVAVLADGANPAPVIRPAAVRAAVVLLKARSPPSAVPPDPAAVALTAVHAPSSRKNLLPSGVPLVANLESAILPASMEFVTAVLSIVQIVPEPETVMLPLSPSWTPPLGAPVFTQSSPLQYCMTSCVVL